LGAAGEGDAVAVGGAVVAVAVGGVVGEPTAAVGEGRAGVQAITALSSSVGSTPRVIMPVRLPAARRLYVRAVASARLDLRPDRTIYSIDGGWFRARWHFSFDRYRDERHMGIGTLRVFNHDTLVPGAVWPMHPHRDIEGITFVVAGEFDHRDSLGNGGVLLPGGVQRMRLGSGAEHSEGNHSATAEMQFIQMWILPWKRGLAPSIVQRQYGVEDRTDRLLRFLRPEGSAGEGIDVAQDASMYASRLSSGRSLAHDLGEQRGGYLYVISGALAANGQAMKTGDAAYVHGPGSLELAAAGESDLLLVDTPVA